MNLQDVSPNLIKYIFNMQKQIPAKVEKIILFGSYAKGLQRVGSDVDVALVANSIWERNNKIEVRELFDDFDQSLEVSLFFTTLTNVNNMENKFDANYWIREEGVLLWQR